MTANARVAFLIALLVSIVSVAMPASALEVSVLDQRKAKNILNAIAQWREQAVSLLIEVGGIESPSGEEQARAERVARAMKEIGLADVRITGAPNAIGRIPGRSGKAIVFVSTLDDLKTVAEHQRERGVPPEVSGDRVVGPGTNTSSTTVAMLTAAHALISAGVAPEHDLIFAAVAQEETGMVGMRELYEEYKGSSQAFIDILGDGRSIAYGALGINWWKVVASGPPGHTLRGGLPNVNLGIARAVDRILGLPQPRRHDDRMTRINIAMLQSGAVFNHKPAEGWFSLDIRSLDAPIITEIEEAVDRILAEVGEETDIQFRLEAINKVPGGQIPGALESHLVRWSELVSNRIGIAPEFTDAGSANLNVAIAAGTPAIGLGGERGGRRGFADEWADIETMMRSAESVALLGFVLGSGKPAPAP